MQTSLELMSPHQAKQAWAFAMPGKGINRRRIKDLSAYVITSCSKEAKFFGIRAGMKYEEAVRLLPELRVLTIGNRHVRSN